MNESNMTKMSIMITRRWSYGSPEVERKLWQWWKKENKKLTWSWTQAEQDAATPHLATGTARISSLGNINVIIMVDMVIIRGKMAIIIIKYSSKDHIPGQYDGHQDCHLHHWIENHHQHHDQDDLPCNDKKSAVWLIAIFALLDLAQLQTKHWLAELQNLSIILIKIITDIIIITMTIILIIISCNQSTCNSSTRTGAGMSEPSVGCPAKFTIFRTWVWWWWL